jgi:hypothetical protein
MSSWPKLTSTGWPMPRRTSFGVDAPMSITTSR